MARAHRTSPRAARRERWFYLMIAPWVVGFVLFQAGPLLASVWISLSRWPLTKPPQWVGLANFRTMLTQDALFGRVLANTGIYAAGSVLMGLVAALLLALLLNQPVRGRRLFRATFFLPTVVSSVATILLWGWIFNPRLGLINRLLAAVGLRGPGWLQSETWAMPALILMSLWGIGWMMLIYLAGLQGVPQHLSEAAAIDGAGVWARFRHITLPMLSPVTFFLLISGTIGSFQVFTPTYLLTRGGPENATLTGGLYIYLNAFQWGHMGYAAALAWVLCLAILLLTVLQFRLARGWVYHEQPDGSR